MQCKAFLSFFFIRKKHQGNYNWYIFISGWNRFHYMFRYKWKYFSWSLSYRGISNTSKNNAGKLEMTLFFVLEYIPAVITGREARWPHG